jgi:hypothetical protein
MRSIKVTQEMAGALAEIFSLPEEAELVTGGRSKMRAFAILDPGPGVEI